MKKYVFVCLTSEGYGGAQLYINYKNKYLNELGFSVFVVSCCREKGKPNVNINIPGITIKSIAIHPKVLLSFLRKRVLLKIRKFLSWSSDDEIIIESLSFPFALWGELIASDTNGKSIVYAIGESNKVNSAMLPFLSFKAKRGEVACIDPNFIYGIYDKFVDVTPKKIVKLEAYIGDVTLDYSPNVLKKIVYSEKNILVFGRLEKQYVIDAANELSFFCSKNSGHSFTLLFIGDSSNKRSKKNIELLFKKISNVRLIMLGGINPVPKNLFKEFDVIIAGSGCASTSFRNGGITIAMDVKDNGLPLGLMGYDTVTTFERDHPDYYRFTLQELLEKLLFENYSVGRITMKPIPLAPIEKFSSHMDFIYCSSSIKSFFSVKKMRANIMDYLRASLVFILGDRIKADAFQTSIKRLLGKK